MSENRAPNQPRSIEDTYVKKTQLEHILLRPDTYIGAIECEQDTQWLYDPTTDSINQSIASISPGLLKIFDEILVNAADNKQRDSSMAELKVWIDPVNESIKVRNDGKGVPIVMHKEHNVWVPELIFGHLLTSSNYDDSQKKTTGGRNGYGAKLANIFSKKFIVRTYDSAQTLHYQQEFRNNMSLIDKPVIEKMKIKGNKGDFTEIEFHPDLSKFPGQRSLSGDVLAILSRRVHDIAGTAPALKVYLNDQLIKCSSFANYVTKFRGGDDKLVCERVNDRWEVGVACSTDSHFVQMSWVNSIATTRGGSHVNYITDQVVKIVADHIEKKNKKLKVKPAQIKNHLAIYVNCLIENPTFDTQTKECLTSKKQTFGSTCELSEKFAKSIISKLNIIDSVLSFAAIKESKELSKNDGKKASRITGIPKLDDANDAGTKDGHKCTLILTEGDSAKALAVAGLSVIGRDRYGVFPLRGKLLNVREASIKQISENAEFVALKKIIGLQQNKVYTDTTSLRYGSIMIMTDQDHDGSHIKGLIINLFACFWPSLLAIEGFLTEFITPIVKVKNNSRKTEQAFYTLPEFNTWKDAQSANGTVGQWSIKYYKGLGTSDANEAKAYFSAIQRHQLTFQMTDQCSQAINLAFAKQLADQRKDWLQTWTDDLFLDQSKGSLTYHEFVHKELILFSVASNQRAIPSMMDGFKPGQRKILYASFLKKLKNELKVAQLAGFVSEKSAYHHGEAALTGTIVGMAQSFVGSNNINLLEPRGMFGTRLAGGKDAASARYIFTCLSPVTRQIFCEHDDALLQNLTDDGMVIEPVTYLPIIPMALVNGSSGIGTGWSSSIPNYSPLDLIECIDWKLHHLGQSINDSGRQLIPHFRGFTGRIVPSGPNKFTVYGVLELINSSTLVISELPLYEWTNDYKLVLEAMLEANEIKTYREYHTDNTVSFVVTFDPAKFDLTSDDFDAMSRSNIQSTAMQNLYKRFKLIGSLATSNMVLFDANQHLKRYDSPQQILDEFFDIRFDAYEKRKRSMINDLNNQLIKLSNKARFILAVCNETLKIRNVPRTTVIKQLIDQKFDRIMSAKKTDAAESEEDDQSAVQALNQSDSGAGFDYLLSMPLWSLTKERVADLTNQQSNKQAEVRSLEATTPAELWLNDLQALKQSLLQLEEDQKKNEKKAIEKALKDAQANQMMQGKGKSKSKSAAPVKLEQLHGLVIEPPTVVEEGEKKKRAPRKIKEEGAEGDDADKPKKRAPRVKNEKDDTADKPAPKKRAAKVKVESESEEDDDEFDDMMGEDDEDDFVSSSPVVKTERPARSARAAPRVYQDISDDSESEFMKDEDEVKKPTKQSKAKKSNKVKDESDFDEDDVLVDDSDDEFEASLNPVKPTKSAAPAKATKVTKPKKVVDDEDKPVKPKAKATKSTKSKVIEVDEDGEVVAAAPKPKVSRAKKIKEEAIVAPAPVVVAPVPVSTAGMTLSERLALRLKISDSAAPVSAPSVSPVAEPEVTKKAKNSRAKPASSGLTPAAKKAKPAVAAKAPKAKAAKSKKRVSSSEDESDASIESLSDESDYDD